MTILTWASNASTTEVWDIPVILLLMLTGKCAGYICLFYVLIILLQLFSATLWQFQLERGSLFSTYAKPKNFIAKSLFLRT